MFTKEDTIIVLDSLDGRFTSNLVYSDNKAKIRLYTNMIDPRDFFFAVRIVGQSESIYKDIVSALNHLEKNYPKH